MRNLVESFIESVEANRSRVALVDVDGSFTFEDLLRQSLALAQLIETLDDGNPGHVGLLAPNGRPFIVGFYAALLAGRASAPVNYLLKPQEIAFCAKDAGIQALLTVSHFRPQIEQLQAAGFGTLKVVYMDELERTERARQAVGAVTDPVSFARALPPIPGLGATAALLYTSGTTATPKGVMLTHANYAHNLASIHQVLDVRREDVFLSVLPMFHSFGLSILFLLPLNAGAKIVGMQRFHPSDCLKKVAAEKVTVLVIVPPMAALLARMGDAARQALASIRIVVCGGGPLADSVARRFEAATGKEILNGYGQTEACPVISVNPPGRNRIGAIGPAVPGVEVAVWDNGGRALAHGEIGEIVVRGGNVMKGYWRRPEETAQTIVNDGWLKTGDLGRLDGDGYLTITGRLKDLIIVGGENVYPQEIEGVLQTHPDVLEAAVVGVGDPLRGEYPKAFVVMKEGVAFNESEMRKFLLKSLASYKVPKEFELRAELPKNAAGKILKRELAG